MTTFDRLAPGTMIHTPEVTITEEHAEAVRTLGGYDHPLFTDREHAQRLGFGGPPVPGEWTLLLLGGLAEKSGAFDDSVLALVAMDEVRFVKPAIVGDRIALQMQVLDRRIARRPDRGTLDIHWRATNQDGEEILSCRVTMLCALVQGQEQQ